MKIAVLNNCVPFVHGGAEHLASALVRKLEDYGHQAALYRVPFRWDPPEKIVESMLACRLMHLTNVDRTIALKFPAYYIPHENKTLWLLHQFRQAYDLWGTEFQCLPDSPEGRQIRHVILHSDNFFLRQLQTIYTNSQITSDRLNKFNNIDSKVLYPPLLDSSHFSCAAYEDYVFYPSRITASKRQHLVVDSMRFVKTPVRVVLAGKAEAEPDLTRLERMIRENQLQDRVELISRFITEQEKTKLFSRALGCVYTPYEEDSYGYVTLEAYHSRKPVITCHDSGGTDVLVKDGLTGYVVAPDPRAIAMAMDDLFVDRRKARTMGEAGNELMRSLNISWDHVIRQLTQ